MVRTRAVRLMPRYPFKKLDHFTPEAFRRRRVAALGQPLQQPMGSRRRIVVMRNEHRIAPIDRRRNRCRITKQAAACLTCRQPLGIAVPLVRTRGVQLEPRRRDAAAPRLDAQHELGELVYAEVPEIGKTLGAAQMFGVVESVKAVGELLSPAAGEVVEVNSAAAEDPTLVNNSPYEEGWLMKIRLDGTLDESNLMDASAYAAYRGIES